MKIFGRIVIFILIFFAGLLIGFSQAKAPAPDYSLNAGTNTANPPESSVNLMIDYGNGEIQAFNDLEITDGQTAYDLLKKVAAENNLDLKIKDYGGSAGAFIEAINKIENSLTKNQYWQYWVNNRYAEIGAGQYELKAGDVLEWKYVKSQYGINK